MKPGQCFANKHMKFDEFGFWNVCRSLSHPFNNRLVFDGRKLAQHFADENKNHAYNVLERLVAKGWIVLLQKSKRGQTGLWSPSTYQILSHEEWAAKGKRETK